MIPTRGDEQPKTCVHCQAGLPRIRFNNIYQHQLPNGDEVTCTGPSPNEPKMLELSE